MGAFEQAYIYAEEALQVPREPFEAEHELLPHFYLLRGEASHGLGDYEAAIASKRKARQLWEAPVWPGYRSSCRVVSEQEPNVDCLSKVYLSLALSYRSLGNHRHALAYQQRVVKLWTRWAPRHPSRKAWMAAAYRDMSVTYWQRRAYVDALWYQLRAVYYLDLP
ncbi:tetratricopeptide repeat protein [Hymenobacter volaticus]|uniref:Tetratricopeptide repeat protein n=1 Tax=Hymenobacter volaticus TaxID=2932254 RepID=A0ABY4GF35_9BACT|nr:tetratricopeptide repeat protein [Hymenobacter volaticus]UOQ69550.1 tetratricopeptide repeat protein [Hymenobacter volaticus]